MFNNTSFKRQSLMSANNYKHLSVAKLLIEARKVVHLYIRKRDAGKPCISCGDFFGAKDPGHYYKAETYSQLRFNTDNIHMQCQRCNGYEDGNLKNYRQGLASRLTPLKLKNLNEAAAAAKRNTTFKWDRLELIQIIQKFKS